MFVPTTSCHPVRAIVDAENDEDKLYNLLSYSTALYSMEASILTQFMRKG